MKRFERFLLVPILCAFASACLAQAAYDHPAAALPSLLEHPDEIHLTQSQMATMVGTAREMVNRSLHTLEDRGVIQLRGQEIRILDPQKLAEIIEAG